MLLARLPAERARSPVDGRTGKGKIQFGFFVRCTFLLKHLSNNDLHGTNNHYEIQCEFMHTLGNTLARTALPRISRLRVADANSHGNFLAGINST